MGVWVWLAMAGAPAQAQGQAAPPVELTQLPGWTGGAKAIADGDGVRVIQPDRDGGYAWVELRVPINLDRYPEILVDVQGAGPKAAWVLKVDPTAEGDPPEVWFIPDSWYNGVFVFPTGEYLERYGSIDAIVRFFVVGKGGAEVRLRRLQLRGEGAANVTETVTVDAATALQTMDGAGGQADYPLWTVGGPVDKVSVEEIGVVLDQLKWAGVSIARVGAYGDVTEAAAGDLTHRELQGLIRHLRALKERDIQVLFVAWFPPFGTQGLPGKTDAWLERCVGRYAQFIQHCHDQGAPIRYFELQNEPYSSPQSWDPDFLGRCGRALSDELGRRGLETEVVGPDSGDPAWAIPWAEALGEGARVIGLKAGADKRGTRQNSAHAIAEAIAECRRALGRDCQFWLTEYGCWAWGNPDEDRRGHDGPCDGYRYGLAMAELTHHYIWAGISAPLIWELVDVRRRDEVEGKATPQDPKRWGMFKYKTEQWEKRWHFHTLGHYFRALQPGAVVHPCESTGGLLPMATRTADGWRVVLTNLFRYPKRARVEVPAGDWGATAEWHVTAPDAPLVTSGVPLADGKAEVVLPGYGVGSLVLWAGGNAKGPRLELPPEVPAALPAEVRPPGEQPADTTEKPGVADLQRGDLLFEDHFDDEFLKQWRPAKDEDVLANGVEPPGVLNMVQGGYLTTEDVFPPERIMEFRVRIEKPEGFELCALPWFAEDREEFYQLSLTPAGYSLHLFQGGFHGIRGETRSLLQGAGWHDVAIRMADQKACLWVDGAFVQEFPIEPFPTDFGRVGFRMGGYKVDDVVVYEVPAGE